MAARSGLLPDPSAAVTSSPRMWRLVAVLLLATAACSGADEPETAEYKLAAVHGDPSTEDDFATILDRMQAGVGACKAEPDREHAGDVLVSSWEQSGRAESLLVWSRALVSACG